MNETKRKKFKSQTIWYESIFYRFSFRAINIDNKMRLKWWKTKTKKNEFSICFHFYAQEKLIKIDQNIFKINVNFQSSPVEIVFSSLWFCFCSSFFLNNFFYTKHEVVFIIVIIQSKSVTKLDSIMPYFTIMQTHTHRHT